MGSSKAASRSPRLGISVAGAQLTWGKDVYGCETGCQGAAPTDPHPTALREQGGASLASCAIPPFADGPHHPQNKVPSNGPAGKPFILSLRNGKAASTTRGLDVLISAHKSKKKKASSNAQGGVSSLLLAPTAPAGNLTVWGPFQSFPKCSVPQPKPFAANTAERTLGFKQAYRTRDQKNRARKGVQLGEDLYCIFFSK